MLRTILFDLGNVIVFFSHESMCNQIGSVLGRTGPETRKFLIDSGLMWDFERGRISEAQLLQAAADECRTAADRTALFTACSNIFTLNEAILPVLAELKRQELRLVLLSNTSAWHIEWVRGHWPVLDQFDQLVLSYEVGAIKPEAGMFEAALEAIHCRPDECFYTDDIPAYVARGREFGLHAEVFTDVESLRDNLQRLGVTT